MTRLVFFLTLTALSAFAADPPKNDPSKENSLLAAVPCIDAETQIAVLSHQVEITTAQLAARPYEDAVRQAQNGIEEPLKEAAKQCGDKHVPNLDLKKHRVVCTPKPDPPGATAVQPAKPDGQPVKPTPAKPADTPAPAAQGSKP